MGSNTPELLLALGLLTMTALPATLAAAPSAAPVDTVVVDAETGERLTPPAQPRTNVTVRVKGVESASDGFDLVGPPGGLFLNQTSRTDGTVEFWDIPAGPGTYQINRSTPDGNEALAEFTVTTEPNGMPDGDCEVGERSVCNSPQYPWCWPYTTSEKLDDEIHWTPLIAVNSPSDGKATASSTWTDTESLYITGGSWKSQTQHSEEIEAQDGESKGFYRSARWGIYERTRHYCSQGYTFKDAKVIDWTPRGYIDETPIDLTGSSRYTDRDNPLRVEAHGDTSIDHDLGYYTRDRQRRGESEHTIQDREITAIEGGVSAGIHYVTFDVIRFRHTQQDQALSYTYHFEDAGGIWHIHDLGDSPGWAFCRPSKADCS